MAAGFAVGCPLRGCRIQIEVCGRWQATHRRQCQRAAERSVVRSTPEGTTESIVCRVECEWLDSEEIAQCWQSYQHRNGRRVCHA